MVQGNTITRFVTPLARAASLLVAAMTLSTLTSCSPTLDESMELEHDRAIERRLNPLDEYWKTENPTCEIRGNSANWQAAYCLWMNSSKDFYNDDVQGCYKDLTEREGIPRSYCERNKYFKREICKTLALRNYFDGSVDSCLKSDESVPLVVREGLSEE